LKAKWHIGRNLGKSAQRFDEIPLVEKPLDDIGDIHASAVWRTPRGVTTAHRIPLSRLVTAQDRSGQ
jgi:hypothetical protein